MFNTGALKILVGASLFALIPVCVMFAGNLSIPTLMFGRLLVACIILLLVQRNRKTLFALPLQTFIQLFGWSLFMLAAMYCYFLAIRKAGMAVSSTLLGTQPLLIVLLAGALLKEKIHSKSVVAAALTFLGIVCITGTSLLINSQQLPGIFLAMFSSLLLALNFILPQKYFTHVSSTQLVFFQCLFQLPLLVPFVSFTFSSYTASAWGAIIALGLVCTVLSYTLIYSGSKQVNAQQIGILQSTEYILPVIIGLVFYHETLTAALLTGTVLIIGACILIGIQPKAPKQG